ncbi:MAG: ABC transporter permease, partial [Anaerolineae bacterium]
MATHIPSQTRQTQLEPDYQDVEHISFQARLKRWFFNSYAGLVYLFLYAPIILLIIYSFNQSRFPTYWTGFTLDWYQVLFNDHLIAAAMKNTLIVTVSSTIIATIIGTMVAVAIERYRFRTKTAVDGLLFLPIIIPDIAMAIMLLVFFKLIHMDLGLPTIIISHVAFNISFVSIIVRARMASLGTTMEEAASDLYANEWKAFWRVTFPLLIPG